MSLNFEKRMHRNKKILLLVVLLILVGFAWYQFRHENKVLDYSDVVLSDSTDFYDLKAVYPREVLDKNGEMEKVVKGWFDSKKQEWRSGGDVYNEVMEMATSTESKPPIKFNSEVTYKKEVSSMQGTVSYVFTDYKFTGGAHGEASTASFTFDDTGLVEIEDILNFDQGNDVKISRMLVPGLLSTLGQQTDEEVISKGLGIAFVRPDGTFDKEACFRERPELKTDTAGSAIQDSVNCDGFNFSSNFATFAVSNEGLRFYLRQGQVASSVVGVPEVTVSWDALVPYLKTKYKKAAGF